MNARHPNIVFVFADQWRQQAAGYAGDPNLAGHTPHIDALAAQSARFDLAVSGCPVCSPYRASLLTGLRPHRHGVFVNDLALDHPGPKLGDVFGGAGYDTAYIGKWHVNGRDRGGFIPKERRAGFAFWETLECTHDYNNSWYWGNDDRLHRWDGYDALDQARHAAHYIRARTHADRPFLLGLSWGPPHNPYGSAPERYRARFDPASIRLRPNVPPEKAEAARRDLAGYYAHLAALDDAFGEIVRALDETGLAGETILVLTSDHGDMIGSQGSQRKQQPWEESLRVPFLLRDGRAGGGRGRSLAAPIDAQDVMPTLCGLAGIAVPDGLDGLDYSPAIRGEREVGDGAALLACYVPFGEWTRERGGREYRGLRTPTHTYARSLDGPWLLYDNVADPYQQRNLIDDPAHAALRARLDAALDAKLAAAGDDFVSGPELLRRWGYDRSYDLQPNGTVKHRNFRPPSSP